MIPRIASFGKVTFPRIGSCGKVTLSFYEVFLFLPLVPSMQLACIASAFWVALTRVKDHMHHPGDVIAGAIVGALIQVSKQRMLRVSLT